ncbi:MAG: biotin--[acetyl-CoA-carboxylase] ligase [Pseudomonadota bacterium]
MFDPVLKTIEFAESTQDSARKLALSGSPSGTSVMAIVQTGGRGRRGATWFSPPGKNLAMSVILRPKLNPREAPILGMLFSIGVADMVDKLCGTSTSSLKWPNDVLVHDRKIAGILSEGQITNSCLEFVILGVGLNVNSLEEDFPADLTESLTSCSILTGRKFDLKNVGMSILMRLRELVGRLELEGSGFVSRLWQERWPHKDHSMCRDGVEGTAVGVDADGALLVESADGRIVKINSGEVCLQRTAAASVVSQHFPCDAIF